MGIAESLLESSSHAIFMLDKDGILTHINRQAKERFGLVNKSLHSHMAGKLEKGDIVVLADTAVGKDDDNLSLKDLEKLGIKDSKIRKGDMLAAVARYQVKDEVVYKTLRSGETQILELDTTYDGIDININIDGKEAAVTIDGIRYSISYFLYIGQIVIIDGKTHQVKFWEEKGFSVRKEGIGSLLRGHSYIAKKPGFQIDIVGHHFNEFFEGELFEQHVKNVLEGKVPKYENEEYDINGYLLTASVFPVLDSDSDGDGIEGVLVRFRRIEDIKTTIMERNEAIKAAEKGYQTVRDMNLEQENLPVDFTSVFGSNTSFSNVSRYAYKLSQLDCSILIMGESGTGKTRMAKMISQIQPRKGPFVHVDCSTITPTLFESEMFGYVGGAFTGANPKGKAGFFEKADGGTIFLDEIGEIPLDIQAKLLNIIQNKVVCRVGSTKMIPVDVRIIAATNKDLKKCVQTGEFRTDLYYRLSAFSIELPPLRKCREDILFIINDLMEGIRKKYNMPERYLSGEVFSKLINYDWPGNIRELENVLERAVALADSDIIYPEHIKLDAAAGGGTLKELLKKEEERIIRDALNQCGGSRSKAMKQLGISKTVFYDKLKEYDIK